MVDVFTDIVIDLPSERVSAYAGNPDHAPLWYVNIKSMEWLTPKPLTIGSEIAFKAHFLGKELAYVYKIEELVPGKKLIMRTADGPFPMETTYIWESVGEKQTKMTLRNRGKPTGFSKIFTPFMSIMMKKANQKDLKKLKTILEKG
ncbi:ATPase [Thalassobacillus devorans]|uniref:ATPase n=1 Tax=Thalassobacillus devorans TaxID=279813 RepID=A0ABQ1NIU6_9BACI|nr:SRPBCC family protein [Thalassobacillus devorans]NIK27235.1 putative membrane protein [Thalassobacillus devorans]GGC76053.1 ATPase [Thalassobacillus devorans]